MARLRGILRLVVLLSVWLAPIGAGWAEPLPLGQAPGYTDRKLSQPPNKDAILRRIWVPGLDEGFVPQGLAWADRHLLLGGYISVSREQSRGPCRIYRIAPESGQVTGRISLPPDCGHAGGLAWDGREILYVADGRRLFAVNLAKALQSGRAEGAALVGVWRLKGDVEGAFAATDGKRLWLGPYARKPGRNLYAFDLERLDKAQDGSLTEKDASASLPAGERIQGAAFDGLGNLWLSHTTSKKDGLLTRHHAKTGEETAAYQVPGGIEGLVFDSKGWLWSVSEAGSRRWLDKPVFYPLAFALDVTALRPQKPSDP